MKKAILWAASVLTLAPSLLWAVQTSMITNPGPPQTSVQFNGNGVFRGSSTFTYDMATGEVSVTSVTASGHIKSNTAAFGFRPMIQSTPMATMADVKNSTTVVGNSLFASIKSTAVQLSNLQAVMSTITAGSINAGQNNAGVIFTSMTVGIGGGSTGTIVQGFSMITYGNNIVSSSATAINIMDCYHVNYGTTADISKGGSGGLDTGAEADVWYSIYAISNDACSQPGILISASNTGTPTSMPAGFTKWRKIGNVKNESSAFLAMQKRDRWYTHDLQRTILNTATPSGSHVALNAEAYVSTSSVFCNFGIIAISGSAANQNVRLKPFGIGIVNEGSVSVQTSTRFDTILPLALGRGPTHQVLSYFSSAVSDNLIIDVRSCMEEVP